MEFSNKLLLSLKQDLKVLNNIITEIVQKLTSFELNSWLFPSKSYKEVLETSLVSISENRQYLGYLELVIDRLYLLIHLIIKYVETFLNVPEDQIKHKNVVRPNNLSLGASTALLWKKMLRLNEIIYDTTLKISREDSENKQIFNKDTQTSTYSSNICSSCASATSCIREIINELEVHVGALSVIKVRENLQNDIYDITQYGCMNRLTTAIIDDIKNFVGRLQTTEVHNKQCNKKIEDLTIKYGESLKMIKNLEGSLKNTQKRSRNVKVNNKVLVKRVNELLQVNQENEHKVFLHREKIKTLERSAEESTVSLALLSTDNEKLQKEIEHTLRENVNISIEKDMWKNRFSETYLENRDLKSKLEEIEVEIQPWEKAMDKIGNDCDILSANLEKNNLKILQRSKMFEKLIKPLMDTVNSKNISDANAVVKNQNFKKITFTISGDPVADMNRQIEINRGNIKKLEQDTTDLLRTIQRVQEKTAPNKFS